MMELPVVAQMVAHTNTWCTPDLEAGLKGIAEVKTFRMHLPEPVTTEGEWKMLDVYALVVAEAIAAIKPTVVLFGCSSAAALLGNEGALKFYDQLAEIIGAPVIGINPMLFRKLEREGIKRLSLVAPYEQVITDALADQLAAAGYEVVTKASMEMPNNVKVGQVSVEDVTRFTLENVASDVDGVLVACGNLRAYEAAAAIRQKTGLPVVTANGAAVDELRMWLEANARTASV